MVRRSALIVEDSSQMAFLLREVLRDMDFGRVETVASASDAKLSCKDGTFSIALVDVGLVKDNGLDFVRDLRADRHHPANAMPVIVVSGQGNRATIEDARRAGANWFLVKPVATRDIVDRINHVLAMPSPRDTLEVE